jgi:hypothetical protein
MQTSLLEISSPPGSQTISCFPGSNEISEDILFASEDWFSSQFSWKHEHSEAVSWFHKMNYDPSQITTVGIFGFNVAGNKRQTAGK